MKINNKPLRIVVLVVVVELDLEVDNGLHPVALVLLQGPGL